MEDEVTCSYKVDGCGEQAIFMLHGWPDTADIWDDDVARLKSKYRCIRMCLPGYDKPFHKKAYCSDDIVSQMSLLIERFSPENKVILMLHDWGCFFGYRYLENNASKVEKLIALDIGDTMAKTFNPQLSEKLYIVTYQWYLALAWLLPRKLGTWMTRRLAKILRVPVLSEKIHAGMNYPYYTLWKSVFLGKSKQQKKPERHSLLCPTLYIYGLRKPIMFQSDAFLESVAAMPLSEVLALNTGHWVMKEKKGLYANKIDEFLNRLC